MIRMVMVCSIVLGLSGEAALAAATWKSGSNGGNATAFASWRGSALGLATGWAPWDNWSNMLKYMSSTNPRMLKSRHSNVSIGVGLFPRSGGNLADCAAGRYASNFRSMGERLRANGVGDAEIRLGWEASNAGYPWTAVGKSATQWKACFTSAAKALKAGSPSLRIAWHMAKIGKINVNTIWPADAPITNIGVSHYDDPWARFGMETENGSPAGLRAWLAFARSKGKKLEMAEWGVGRRGDNPAYIAEHVRLFPRRRLEPGARGLPERQRARPVRPDQVAKVERALPRAVLARPAPPPGVVRLAAVMCVQSRGGPATTGPLGRD